MNINEIQKDLIWTLKNISTYEDFEQLQKSMKEKGFAFFGKRRNILITGFQQGINKEKINYIYDDGTSYGACYIKNFYKIAYIDDY